MHTISEIPARTSETVDRKYRSNLYVGLTAAASQLGP
jgi:hypothetical protein